MKVFLIKSNQQNGHYRAQRHFSFAGDVVTEDALTAKQWAEVRGDAWLSVVEVEPDAETAVALDELAKAEATQAEADQLATEQEAAEAEADKLTAEQATAQKAKGKQKQ